MDRVDIRVDLAALHPSTLTSAVGQGESSAVVGERVVSARERAAFRWRGTPWRCAARGAGGGGAAGVAAGSTGGGVVGSGGADRPVDRAGV